MFFALSTCVVNFLLKVIVIFFLPKSCRKLFFSHIYQRTKNKKYNDQSFMRLINLYVVPEVAFAGPSTPEEFENGSFTSNVFHPHYEKHNNHFGFFF